MQLVHRSTKVLTQARGRVEERFGFGGDPVVLGDRVNHGTQHSAEAFASGQVPLGTPFSASKVLDRLAEPGDGPVELAARPATLLHKGQ